MIINILIFLAGLLVYAGYGLPGLAYLAAAAALSYGLGLLIPRVRWLVWPGVCANVLMLLLLSKRNRNRIVSSKSALLMTSIRWISLSWLIS